MNNCKALLLNNTHHIWGGTWIEGESLHAITQSLKMQGMQISSPIGTRPPYFILMCLDETDVEETPDWVPLEKILNSFTQHSQDIFNIYCELLLGGFQLPSRSIDVFSFGFGSFMATQLAHLVAKGNKRCTAGWIPSNERENATLPKVGGYSIVTDAFGIPICLIQMEKIFFTIFSEVTEETAFREGEGNLSLEDWMEGHRNFFKREAESSGTVFTDDEEIFVEYFNLIKVFGNAPQKQYLI